MSHIGMFDLLTPAVPVEFPWPILWTRLLCEGPHVPKSQYAPATPLLKRAGHWTLRQVAIFAHLKYTHLANWGRGGLGDCMGKDPLMQLWPPEKAQTRKFCGCKRAGGGGGWGSLDRGCLAVAALLCPKGGKGAYLFEAAGGWWGANLLSGCVIGPPVPNSLLAVRACKKKKSTIYGPQARTQPSVTTGKQTQIEHLCCCSGRAGFTTGLLGWHVGSLFSAPLHELSAPSLLLCKHYKLAICIWMGPQSIQEGDTRLVEGKRYTPDIRSPLFHFSCIRNTEGFLEIFPLGRDFVPWCFEAWG